jgi:formate-dependent nitrite reductase cytochrome c552 subunit
VDSEICRVCHSITYGEWRISAHGQKGIRCFDCHKMHGMHLRKDDPDQMCGSCHTKRLESFSHATHHLKGVQCISCHMPEVRGGGMKIKGAGLRGHTYGVGAETCTQCHREMVHESHETASLTEEVARLKAVSPAALQQQIETLQTETTALRADLQANRRVFMPVVGLAFLLGISAGYALPHFRSRKS